jgi:hypothetical protein
VDRILDIMLVPPKRVNKMKAAGKANRAMSGSSSDVSANAQPARSDGVEPPKNMQLEVSLWERQMGRDLEGADAEEIVDQVVWCLVSPAFSRFCVSFV